MAALEGIINLDKPVGLSSARAVGRIKRMLPRGIKVGHAGTLDPFATGVLLVLVGRATRQCEVLMNQPKTYQATVKLGASTPTFDPESAEMQCLVEQPPGETQIREALAELTGVIWQVPPAFSAMKVGGRRAYKLARAGRPPALPARQVRIDRIDFLGYDWPTVRLDIQCGRGTYIRSLARDLGVKLGVGGYLLSLHRLRVGEFGVPSAATLEMLENGVERYLHAIPAPDGSARPNS